MYIADTGNHRIRKVTVSTGSLLPAQVVVQVAVTAVIMEQLHRLDCIIPLESRLTRPVLIHHF